MAIIYQKNGESVYDDPVKGTVSAKTGQPISATIPPQDTINSDVLSGGSEQQINLPLQQPVTETDFKANTKAIESLFSAPLPEEKQNTDFSKRILELTQAVGGKEQFAAEQDKTLGLTEVSNQINELVDQIKAYSLEANAIPESINQEFLGRGATPS